MKKRGPKPLFSELTTTTLQIRLPDDIMGDLKFLAENKKMRVSAYARLILIRKMSQELHEFVEEIRQQVTQI